VYYHNFYYLCRSKYDNEIVNILRIKRNATQRNATQRNATQRNATQHNALIMS